jgi:hypothetical protein
MTTYLQERADCDDRLEDREATSAPAASVLPRTGGIDSTSWLYGTAVGWAKLGVFAWVPGDQSRVSYRPEGDQ